MGSLTVEDMREKLGLKPAPTVDNYADRGSGKTTEMLLRALEDASKGNVVHIIGHDMRFCGYMKSIITDYAKILKIDSKLIQFVAADRAGYQLLGNHKLHLYVDHFVRENGMYIDYKIEDLEAYAESTS